MLMRDGLWQTADALDFRWDVVDAEHCATVTQPVIEERYDARSSVPR